MAGRTVLAHSGRVVVTDLNTKHLAPLASSIIEVRQHNIVEDELEEQAFDLAFARLVLEHIPEREAVLDKLVRALKPGGWLLLGVDGFHVGVAGQRVWS